MVHGAWCMVQGNRCGGVAVAGLLPCAGGGGCLGVSPRWLLLREADEACSGRGLRCDVGAQPFSLLSQRRHRIDSRSSNTRDQARKLCHNHQRQDRSGVGCEIRGADVEQ